MFTNPKSPLFSSHRRRQPAPTPMPPRPNFHVLALRPGSAYKDMTIFVPETVVISAINHSPNSTATVRVERITPPHTYAPIADVNLPPHSPRIGIGRLPRGRYNVGLHCNQNPTCSTDVFIEGVIEMVGEQQWAREPR